jgi:hypothetical protein
MVAHETEEWPRNPLGFFTPFSRRFFGGSELVSSIRFYGCGPGHSDIFAGRLLSDPAFLKNGLERLNPRRVASTIPRFRSRSIFEQIQKNGDFLK